MSFENGASAAYQPKTRDVYSTNPGTDDISIDPPSLIRGAGGWITYNDPSIVAGGLVFESQQSHEGPFVADYTWALDNESLGLTKRHDFLTSSNTDEYPFYLRVTRSSSVLGSSQTKKHFYEYTCTDHGLFFTDKDQTV